MKKLAFGLYVAIVLLVSGLARAEGVTKEISPAINNVEVAENVLALRISGILPNPNTAVPHARLTQDESDPRVLILTLTTSAFQQISITQAKNYSVVVSIPEVARAAGLNVDEKMIYVLKVQGYAFELQFSGADLMTVFPMPVPVSPVAI